MATNLVKVNEFKNVLNDSTIRAQVKNSLKENSGAFMSSMIDLYSGDPYLQMCDPKAVALECLKAASLKLPLVKSLGFAYVVPYKNVPTFTIGYKGLIQLAQRSGQYQYINADTVFEGEITGRDKLSGMIKFDGEAVSDEIEGYFAYFKLLNGFEKTLYMTKQEMTDYAYKYSPIYKKGIDSNKSSQTPWFKEFDKMAIKTVLRRLIGTYGVMTNEMQTAMTIDDKPSAEDVAKEEISKKANAETIDFDPVEVVEEDPAQLTEEEKRKIERAEMEEMNFSEEPSFA